MQTSTLSDSELSALMQQAINGDRSAYATCLTSFAAISRALCATRLQDECEIERIVQISLVRAHKKSCTFERGGSFTSWACAITRRELDEVAPTTARRRPGVLGEAIGFSWIDQIGVRRNRPADFTIAAKGDGP